MFSANDLPQVALGAQ